MMPVVLVLSESLGDSKTPIFHEFESPGRTRCGREFYISAPGLGGRRMVFVTRSHASKFARQCSRCARKRPA